MKRRYWNISIGVLYGVLIIILVMLYLTSETRYSYAKALSSTEEQLREEFKHQVAYLNSQTPYLNEFQNSENLKLKYCESLTCIDSLELQFQEKLGDASIIKDQIFPFLYTTQYPQWNELKSFLRLQPIIEMYKHEVMSNNDDSFIKAKIIKGVLAKPFVGWWDYNPVLSNNLISINKGPFIRDTSQWFTVPYVDKLKLTYFKDNYSYGYGRDSIIKEYVYDISEIKAERGL